MKNMRDQLKKIKEDHRDFQFVPYQGIYNEHQFTDRETTSKVNKADILGRDKERKGAIASLSASNNQENATILPIFGLGGIGKTTLAQLVFSDIHFKDYDHRIWVYVSQVFDLGKIGNTIISQVLKEGGHIGLSKEFIYQRLHELLDDKKTLIILDDLWETNDSQLNELKLMLNVSSKTKVLVTTRNEEIANRIGTVTPCRLSPLNNDICWDIIKKNTKFESREDKQQLQKIGQVIASKCGGVPLAAQALGFMLSRMDLKKWEEVSNSDIWNEPFPENSVLPSLKLTYIAMPPNLRLCFAYCAMFPRGFTIAKYNLIHQWIALDFVKPSNVFSDIQNAEKYVEQLLGMSFLQPSKLPTTDWKQSGFTMHDLVYDLARSVMGEELIVYNANNVRSMGDRKYCRYAIFTNCSNPLKISTILPPKLRALFFHDSRKLDLQSGAFSSAKYLRVLDLTESSIGMLPSSIGHLKQMRFLIAPGMNNRRFPCSITGLLELKYLNLSGSSRFSAIPASIGKLVCLKHLDLSGCTKLAKMPKSLGNLRKLLHLDLSSCSSLKRIPGATCNLTCLQYLNLSRCSNLQMLPQDLGSLEELQYFSISACSKIVELPVSFRKLTNLVHLDLSRCSFVMPEVLGGFTNLKFLNLSGSLNNKGQAGENIDYISTLTKLVHLDLSWNSIPSLPISIGNLKRLHTLDVSGCACLSSLPGTIGSIASLELLLVNGCSSHLKNYIRQSGLKCNPFPHLVVCPNNDDSGSNLHELEDRNPSELQISCLEKIRIRGEASGIELCNKENLSELTLHWAMETTFRTIEDKDVLGELVPPKGLEHLELRGYSSTGFPNWFMEISYYLPFLVYVELEDLPRCSDLPPFGQLPNLKGLYLLRLRSIKKISGDFCGGNRAFPQLTSFTLGDMQGLEEWNTTYCGHDGTEDFMFPSLVELKIYNCPKLRLKPCPPTFRNWNITDCDEVLNSGEEGENFSHYDSHAVRTNLVVQGSYCGNWRLLHHLPTLQRLGFDCLYRMTSLPQSLRQLASLRFLVLHKCNNLSSLPEWISDIKSLEDLEIVGCDMIKSIPSSIQQLTKLKNLRILDCSELERWCAESEENWMKLAHIKHVVCDDIFPSLA
ncbi:unnamed protein product [Urochloa decumbens]|uniref:NB-ARC domain-containing protein n=1 Tax=Urochloa decumbens TaxID=240449 RepID=A0ABC9B9U8_9POAL